MNEHSRDVIVTIVDRLGKICIASIIAYCLVLVSENLTVFAGKQTDARFLFNFLTTLSADRWGAWLVASLASGWALGEHKLRKYKTKKLADHARELEQKIDPKRESSNLTKSGDTNPKDV